MISAIARHDDGLPAEALPFAVNETTQIGFDFMMAALAYGAARIAFLVGRGNRGELAALAQQVGLAETALVGLGYGSGRVDVIDDMEPDGVVQALASEDRIAPEPGAFLPMGGKRTITMLALRHLREHAPTPVDLLPLPQGAPFGAVVVETAGCTLCLSCVGACPTGALVDNPDKPMLGFQEEACIQCGLCRSTCPEQVISLEPRLNFAEASRTTVVLKEEEPALCVRCGKPFGTKSSIERIVARLAGQHSMFASSAAAERIRMCEDCRVIVQFEAPQPLAGPPRPPPRNTDDYLRNRTIIPPKIF
jgi:ferredoxin